MDYMVVSGNITCLTLYNNLRHCASQYVTDQFIDCVTFIIFISGVLLRNWRRPRTITLVAYIFIIVFAVMITKTMIQSVPDNYMSYVYEANGTFLKDPFIHKHKYRLSLNNANVCDRNIFLLITVNSDPENRNSRNIIRDTWGSVKIYNGLHIRVVFFMGDRLTPKRGRADELTDQLTDESFLYGDIARGDFIDDYFNLTYKTVLGLHWMTMYCPKANFVVKVDDDVMVNIYKLVNFLQEHNKKENLQHFYYGSTFNEAHPIREKTSKWHISYSDYKYSKYPAYCAGLGYIFSNQAAGRIYQATSKIPFFWVDDVFIGFCAELSTIRPIHHYFGYYMLDKRYRDVPWEYTIVKEIDRDRQELSQEAWTYINIIKYNNGLTYISIRYIKYILLCLRVSMGYL